MNVGGVEKSFINLLPTLSPEQYEIHLGLLSRSGGFLSSIPATVHIHDITAFSDLWPIINDPPRQTVKRLFREGKQKESAIFFALYIWMKLTGSNYWTYRYLLRKEPVFPEVFDAAFAYAGPSQLIDYYVCEKVNASKKYGWIHFDISHFGIDKGMTRQLYRQYEKIFVVSKEAREIFISTFPQFADKTAVFNHIINPESIRQQAENAPTFDDDFNGRRILTVGRVSKEKGQLMAILAMKRLLNHHPNVRWYFVGEGKDLDACRDLASQEGLGDAIVFLGLQTNPYGFMKDCDLYVQPSFHEGFCITLAEALCFDKPTVATKFIGAKEQFDGKADTWLADINPESLADTLATVLSDLKR